MKKERTIRSYINFFSRQSVIYLEQITVVAGAHGIEP